MNWILKPFHELSISELYNIMRLRQEIFVVEQKCPFIDADDKDQPSHHLMGFIDNHLAAYARILPQGIAYDEISIGRIVTSEKYRKSGYGRLLMQQSLIEAEKLFGKVAVRIEAQFYLKKFYEDYGFVQTSEPYILDDILHAEMLRPVVS